MTDPLPPFATRWPVFALVPRSLAPLLLALCLGGCAPAHLAATWRAPGPPPAIQGELAVFGVADSDKVRRAYEDSFVATLGGLGVAARPGHGLLTGRRLGQAADVEQAVRRAGCDAVLVTHLVGSDGASDGSDDAVLTPAAGDHDLYSYYSRIYGEVRTPGYYQAFRVLRLETNLYDAHRETLLWSGRSGPLDPDSEQVSIGDVIARAILQLRADGLLPAAPQPSTRQQSGDINPN